MGPQERPSDRFRLLLVEGSLQGGYETGLETAIGLAGLLADKYPLELMVAGSLQPEKQREYQQMSRVPLRWAGLVPRDHIPAIDRSAHLLYSADLNAACPNSVIEALACGLPVAAFSTGALPELVTAGAGRLVPYGGDPWKLEKPDLPALAKAAAEILVDQERFRAAARQRAEAAFGLDRMVEPLPGSAAGLNESVLYHASLIFEFQGEHPSLFGDGAGVLKTLFWQTHSGLIQSIPNLHDSLTYPSEGTV